MSETSPSPTPPPRARGKNLRAIFFLIGMLAAMGALVFSVAPREWFEATESAGEDDLSAMSDSDPQHQLVVLEKMWKEHPDHAPIALQLAHLYHDQGDYQKAIDYYRAFLKVDTSANGFEVGLDLAQALESAHLTEEAIAELKRILKRDPTHAGALYNWGAISANNGDFNTAKQAWNLLIEKHPTDTLAIFAKGSLPRLDQLSKSATKPAGHP